jgi:hypothetical protein
VGRLRIKLHGVSPGWTYIHTHFGIGYRRRGDEAAARAAVEGDPLTSVEGLAAFDEGAAEVDAFDEGHLDFGL